MDYLLTLDLNRIKMHYIGNYAIFQFLSNQPNNVANRPHLFIPD